MGSIFVVDIKVLMLYNASICELMCRIIDYCITLPNAAVFYIDEYNFGIVARNLVFERGDKHVFVVNPFRIVECKTAWRFNALNEFPSAVGNKESFVNAIIFTDKGFSCGASKIKECGSFRPVLR